jgi:hypothetical protein
MREPGTSHKARSDDEGRLVLSSWEPLYCRPVPETYIYTDVLPGRLPLCAVHGIAARAKDHTTSGRHESTRGEERLGLRT